VPSGPHWGQVEGRWLAAVVEQASTSPAPSLTAYEAQLQPQEPPVRFLGIWALEQAPAFPKDCALRASLGSS
jgi:hypothetical protein